MKKFFSATNSKGRIKFFLFGKKVLSFKTQTEILKNVFQKNNDKNVLISYVKKTFKNHSSKRHTNFLECFTAAEIFDKLGYNVDVIEFTDSIETEQLQHYDIVYGFGKSLEKALLFPQIKKIFYGTGCSPWFQNIQTLNRLESFYAKKSINAYKSSRFTDSSHGSSAALFCKNIIALGNNFVANTYVTSGVDKKIKYLPAFYFDVYNIDLEKKDFLNTQKTFLWFGSTGCIHKGLDILIDIFKKRKDINLIICGANPNEKEFFKYYQDVFDGEYQNITYYPFVDIESEQFKTIMNQCGAVVFPTASEGGSPSLLMVMANGGLIPIISKNAGIDIDDFGIQFDEISLSSVEKNINFYLSLSESELKKRAYRTKETIKTVYTYQNYRKNLESLIQQML